MDRQSPVSLGEPDAGAAEFLCLYNRNGAPVRTFRAPTALGALGKWPAGAAEVAVVDERTCIIAGEGHDVFVCLENLASADGVPIRDGFQVRVGHMTRGPIINFRLNDDFIEVYGVGDNLLGRTNVDAELGRMRPARQDDPPRVQVPVLPEIEKTVSRQHAMLKRVGLGRWLLAPHTKHGGTWDMSRERSTWLRLAPGQPYELSFLAPDARVGLVCCNVPLLIGPIPVPRGEDASRFWTMRLQHLTRCLGAGRGESLRSLVERSRAHRHAASAPSLLLKTANVWRAWRAGGDDVGAVVVQNHTLEQARRALQLPPARRAEDGWRRMLEEWAPVSAWDPLGEQLSVLAARPRGDGVWGDARCFGRLCRVLYDILLAAPEVGAEVAELCRLLRVVDEGADSPLEALRQLLRAVGRSEKAELWIEVHGEGEPIVEWLEVDLFATASDLADAIDDLTFSSRLAHLLSVGGEPLHSATTVAEILEMAGSLVDGAEADTLVEVRFRDPSHAEWFRAIEENRVWMLSGAPRELLADRDFVLAAVMVNGHVIAHANPRLREDPELRRLAVLKTPSVVHADDFTNDVDNWLLALSLDKSVGVYLPMTLRRHPDILAALA
jgi:hypothetical protein